MFEYYNERIWNGFRFPVESSHRPGGTITVEL